MPHRPSCQRKRRNVVSYRRLRHNTQDMSISKTSASEVREIIPAAITRTITTTILKRRQLSPPRVMTGQERRWINPNKGAFKILERNMDILVSRFLYPHLAAVWNPYSWLLEKRFVLAETALSPQGWPAELDTSEGTANFRHSLRHIPQTRTVSENHWVVDGAKTGPGSHQRRYRHRPFKRRKQIPRHLGSVIARPSRRVVLLR